MAYSAGHAKAMNNGCEASRVAIKTRTNTPAAVVGSICKFGTMLLAGLTANIAHGQAVATWEYSPYTIRVWVAAQPSVEINQPILERIETEIDKQCHVAAGATWQLKTEPAPKTLRATIASAPEQLTIEQIHTAVENVFQVDKVLMLGLRARGGQFEFTCRELDGQTRTLSRIVRGTAYQLDYVPQQAARTTMDSFSALVRIEQSRGKSATTRVRAGGLAIGDSCPSRVDVGDVLRPIIRRNDRQGEPRPGGIQIVDWTFLTVRQRHDYLLDCEVYSAMRNPLAGRNSARIQRLALKVRPETQETVMQLLSKSENPQPLEGYEIFAKKPLPKNPETKNRAERLGLTDWRGTIDIPADKLLLRIVYVKNGNHLIARLPIVPGYQPKMTMQLSSDDKRLETEAFVKGMESMVMDLVARRAILTARIRRRLKEGKTSDAKKLLDEIKSFRTKDDLEMMLASRQKSGLTSNDPREQRRIDQLLSGVRILLNKYLDPEALVALQREVNGEPPLKKPPGPAPKATPKKTQPSQ